MEGVLALAGGCLSAGQQHRVATQLREDDISGSRSVVILGIREKRGVTELVSERRPQASEGAQELSKSSLWSDKIGNRFRKNMDASSSQLLSCQQLITASFSGDRSDQSVHKETVSRREWLLASAALATVASPSNAHGVSRLYHLGEDNSSAGSAGTIVNGGSSISSKAPQQLVEDVKSWYRYRGEGFVLRVPPGYEDVLDPIDEESSTSLYGERAKERPFAARFASPDRDEILSIVVKQASQMRLSFFETKDISDFGNIKDAAPSFVPAGAKIVSARIINSKGPRSPRTYYMYEFLAKGMHFMMSAGVARGRVFVLGASSPQSKWADCSRRLQLATSTFYLP